MPTLQKRRGIRHAEITTIVQCYSNAEDRIRIFLKIRRDIRKSRCATGVKDTGGNIATSIDNTSSKFATGIKDIGGKFCHHFATVLLIPVATNGNNIRLRLQIP